MFVVYILMWREGADQPWQFRPSTKAEAYAERDRRRNAGVEIFVLKGE